MLNAVKLHYVDTLLETFFIQLTQPFSDHHLDLPSALWTCVGSFSPLFISSTTTLVCWFTLRAKKPQQTDYRLAGEHSVTPFVVPYAKQISTSLKKELTTDSLLQIEINPWSPGSQPNPDSSHRGLSGSFSPVIIPLMVLDLQQASTFQPKRVKTSPSHPHVLQTALLRSTPFLWATWFHKQNQSTTMSVSTKCQKNPSNISSGFFSLD